MMNVNKSYREGFINGYLWATAFAAVILVILYASIGNAETPATGHDHLALQQENYKSRLSTKFVEKGTSLGTLHNTFGTELGPIRGYLMTVQPRYYRVHLINGPCIRAGNCGSYEIGYGYTKESFNKALLAKNPKVIKYLEEATHLYLSLQQEFLMVKFIISPVLEHDLSKQAWRNAADAVLSVWPSAQLSNSADLGVEQERYKGAWIEKHGNTGLRGADIVSFDGVDASDSNIPKFLKETAGVKIRFIWNRQYNCRTNGEFIDPRKRDACPKAYEFEELSHIFDARGKASAPEFKCKFKEMRGAATWKTFSEDKGTGDPRARLPVAILPGNDKGVEVVGKDGKVAGSLAYYGPFQAAGYRRYYSGHGQGSGLGGYQFEKLTGPWAWFKQGGTCWGPIVPGRRGGTYR